MTISPHFIVVDEYETRHNTHSSAKSTSSDKKQHSSLPRLPPSLGQYTIIRTLGKGSCSKVQLARHSTTGELVAIKIIQKENFVKDRRQQERLRREVRILSLLQHPFIVSLKGVVETNDTIYIVMEYLAGGELFDYISNNPSVTEQEIRHLFRQILSAVYYCHLNNIIHRDLKLENLLLDENGNIKIIDFGFGNVFGHSSHLNTFCGSPYYAAPEMISGRPYHGPEVDIWSLGVVLYVLFARRLPFEDLNTISLYQKITRGDFTIPSFIPEGCQYLLINMLCPNPSSRYTMHQVLTHPWINIGHRYPPDPMIPHREPINSDTMDLNVTHYLLRSGYTMTQIQHILFSNVSHPLKSEYYLLVEGMKDGRVSIAKPSIESLQSENTSRRNSDDFALQNPSQLVNTRKKSLPQIYSSPNTSSVLNHLTVLKDDAVTVGSGSSDSIQDNLLKRIIGKIFKKMSIHPDGSTKKRNDSTYGELLSSSGRGLALKHMRAKSHDATISKTPCPLKTFSKWNLKKYQHLILEAPKTRESSDNIGDIMNCIQISLHRLGILFDMKESSYMHHCTYYPGTEDSPLLFDLELGLTTRKDFDTSFVVVLTRTNGSFWLWRRIVSDLFSLLKVRNQQ